MNLIYFTIGHNPAYVKLLELCLKSLRKHCDMSHIKTLIMCDKHYQQYIQHLPFDYFVVTDDNHSPEQTSMRKIEIFGFQSLYLFDKVIFLDADIIITGDLNVIFDKMTDDEVLYTFNESDDFREHNLVYFGMKNYDDRQLQEFVKRNVKVFNCGQFGFIVSHAMGDHFSNVLYMMKTHQGEHYYEQSFMNYYFNTHYLTNPIFNQYTILPTRGDRKTQETCIAHFANASIPIMHKYQNMLSFINS